MNATQQCLKRPGLQSHVFTGPRCHYCNEMASDRERVRAALRAALLNLDQLSDTDMPSYFIGDAIRLGNFVTAHAIANKS